MDEIDIHIMDRDLFELEEHLPGTKQSDLEYIKRLNTGWKDKKQLASERQVGGDHYKDYEIQPGEYCQVNGLPYMESNAIKYITRHGKKHNGREDIEKAIHCLELVLEWDYDER